MENLFQKTEKDHVIITEKEKTEWRSVTNRFFIILTSDPWRVIILIFNFVNYFVATIGYIFLQEQMSDEMYYAMVVFDTMYFVDYGVNLILYFWKKAQIRLNKRPRKKWVLILDIFLTFPYSYIYEAITGRSHGDVMFLLMRSVMVLRLIHFVLYCQERMDVAGADHILDFMIQCAVALLLLQQTAACIFYMMAWSDTIENTEKKWTKIPKLRRLFNNRMEHYFICLTFVLFNITQRTFGDIVPLGSPEKILIILITSIGFTATTGLFIGVLSFLFEKTYLRTASLRYQIQDIKEYLKNLNMKHSDKERIRNYYRIFWEKKDGVHEIPVYPQLPFSLYSEISVDINIGPLQRSTIFRDKEDAFLRAASSLMKHEFHQTNDLIYHANVVKNKMIFVVSGTIEMLSDEDNESTIISFGEGTCLGECSLILSLPSKWSVKAACYTELQVLYRKDFYTLIDLFPEIFQEIRGTIMQRIKDAYMKRFTKEQTLSINLHSYFSHDKTNSTIKILKDKLRDRIPKKYPEDIFLSMYKLSDESVEIDEKNIFINTEFPWILQPDTSFHHAWQYLIIIIASFIALFYPYFIVFRLEFTSITKKIFEYIDIILMVDVLVILCTAIKEKNKTIKTFMDILRKRLTEPGFYFDFFSCIKFEAFCNPFSEEQRICQVLRLNRLLKSYRIPKIIVQIDNNLFGHVVVLRLIKYLIFILVSVYWCGALLYLATCFDKICTDDGWFFKKLMRDLRHDLAFSYSRNRLITSIYYSIFYVTSPSFKDIIAHNILDMIMGYSATLFGLFLMGYCVAELSATITHQRKAVTEYQENFFSLLLFLKEKNMPKSIIQRVENFFVLQWNYDKGVSMKGSLFYNANSQIQTMVDMAEKWDVLVNLPVLQGRNYEFLQRLVTETTTLVLPPQEYITYKREISGILYIILEGFCVREIAGPLETKLLGPRAFFGSIALFANVNSMSTIKTLTHVKMLCMSHDALWKCASLYPMVSHQLTATLNSLDLEEYIRRVPESEIFEEHEMEELNGSIVNVYSYCKRHQENYNAPFNKLSYMCWLKFVLLPICILPYGTFLKIWMTIRLIVASFVAILTPYELVQYPYAPYLYKILDALDLVAYLDLYVMMLVGYYGPKNQLIMHPLKTAAHYIKGKFVIDLIFCFPWEFLVSNTEKLIEGKRSETLASYNFIATFRIIRVFQIYRLPQFFNYLSQDIRRKGNVIQIAKFLPTIVIAINFCAAVLIATSCTYFSRYDLEPNDIYNETYVQPEGYMHHPLNHFTMFCKIQSWIDRSVFRNLTDPFQVYMVAIYFCSSSVTTCGFGDITPQYPNTLIITVLMIICGFLFFGYIYAKISSHKADWRALQVETQEMVFELKKFMMSEKVDKKFQEQIIERLEYTWKRSRGAEPNVILASLNPTLHEDAVLSMYEQILTEVPIFADIDRSFFRVVGKIIREMYYLRQEYICQCDDILSKICILYRGTVKITSKDGSKDIFMGRGGIFGNISFQPKHKISITVTTVSKVDILSMDSNVFFRILEKFPEIKRSVEAAITNTDFMQPFVQENYDITVLQEMENTERREFTNNFIRCLQIMSCWKLCRTAISPHSLIYSSIDLICLILAYANCIMVTYEFSFRHHSVFLLVKSIIIDLIFFVRLILNMHKSYEDDFGELVESNSKILDRYFENRTVRRSIDFLANIPFYYVAFLLELQKDGQTYLYFSTMRLVTVMRFLIFFDYYNEKSNQLLVKASLLKIITTVVWVTLIIHVFACGWYLCACPLVYCVKNGWTTAYLKGDEDKLQIYITCIYFMTGLFTAASNGDILPNTFTEQIYITVVMILANFLIGIFIGDIMNTLNTATLGRVNYERGIRKLKQYLRNCNVSDFQMEKLKNYVEKLWAVSNGTQIPRLVSSLHYSTVNQLMSAIYGHHLKNSYVFKDVEEAFARQLSGFLKRNVFFPGNYIVKHGDSDKSMYFIHYGEVDILTIHPNLTETIHEVLQAGEVFGVMQGLYHGIPHHFSYRAKTTVKTVSLCLGDWEHLLDFFPDSKKSIYAKATAVHA